MDKKQYDEGYNHGAGATQDQARGARDYQADRERRERERQAEWDRINRDQAEEQRRREQASRRDQERREAERMGAAKKPAPSKAAKKSEPNVRDVITFIGFIAGAVFGYKGFPDNWIVILICAALAAAIARVFYKLIIGVAVLAGALWIWSQSGDDSRAAQQRADPVSAAVAQRAQTSSSPTQGGTQAQSATVWQSQSRTAIFHMTDVMPST